MFDGLLSGTAHLLQQTQPHTQSEQSSLSSWSSAAPTCAISSSVQVNLASQIRFFFFQDVHNWGEKGYMAAMMHSCSVVNKKSVFQAFLFCSALLKIGAKPIFSSGWNAPIYIYHGTLSWQEIRHKTSNENLVDFQNKHHEKTPTPALTWHKPVEAVCKQPRVSHCFPPFILGW